MRIKEGFPVEFKSAGNPSFTTFLPIFGSRTDGAEVVKRADKFKKWSKSSGKVEKKQKINSTKIWEQDDGNSSLPSRTKTRKTAIYGGFSVLLLQ